MSPETEFKYFWSPSIRVQTTVRVILGLDAMAPSNQIERRDIGAERILPVVVLGRILLGEAGDSTQSPYYYHNSSRERGSLLLIVVAIT